MNCIYPFLQFQAKNSQLNNESSISELQDFKIFWGRIPPDAPTRWRFRRSLVNPPPPFKIRSAVPVNFNLTQFEKYGQGVAVIRISTIGARKIKWFQRMLDSDFLCGGSRGVSEIRGNEQFGLFSKCACVISFYLVPVCTRTYSMKHNQTLAMTPKVEM